MSNKITIGVDASRSIDSIQKTGVEKVSDGLLKTIVDTNVVFYTPEYVSWLPKDKQKIINFKKLWTVLGLSLEMLLHKPCILFIPVHTLPFFCPKKTFKIIHDIAFLKNPELYSIFQRWYLNFDLKRCIKKCKKIFVPTKQVKQDILNYVDIYVDKIVVIPHGYSQKNTENTKTPARNDSQARLQRCSNFGQAKRSNSGRLKQKKQILYIGRVEEKKNISNLIKAFEIFSEKNPNYKLILAGKIDKKYLDILNSRFQILDSIKLLGYISDEKKFELLQKSACLVLPSKEEGFGFPILEGWDYELPVLASNIPVLQEVGGDACCFVNPDSIQDIAKGLAQITENKNLQNDLIKKGSERLKKFSWQIAAEKYLNEILQ